jgi:uncharacterized protein (DUF433 family)
MVSGYLTPAAPNRLRSGVGVSGVPIGTLAEQRQNRDMNAIDRFPGLMLGQPVITGTRLPVFVIVQAIAAGDGREELLEAYPFLTVQDIEAALSSAARLAERGPEVAS